MYQSAASSATTIAELQAQLTPMPERWHYCFDRLLPFANDKTGALMDRAKVAGARLLGCQSDYFRDRIPRIVERGGVDAFLDYRRERLGFTHAWSLDAKQFGYVYLARVRRYPHVIKVGLSTKPDERMKALKYQTKEEHDLIAIRPGTFLDEAIEFIARRADHIASEWFLDGGAADQEIPPFLMSMHSAAQWAEAIGLQRQMVEKFPFQTGNTKLGLYTLMYLRAGGVIRERDAA